MKDCRIALVTFHSEVSETEKNVARMVRWIHTAKQKDVSLICFPECSITGYISGKEVRDIAEPISSPYIRQLQDLSRDEKMVILAGMIEKDASNGVFASHVMITPEGEVGVYRKLHLAPPEQTYFSAGNKVPVFTACGITFGIQLCYDIHFPELSTYMALQQIDALFVPHASPRGTPGEKYTSWLRHLPARAYDNGIFVFACNQVGQNGRNLTFPGVAVAIDPSGEVFAKQLSEGEDMVIIDINAQELRKVRTHRMRYFLPNRRADLFHFRAIE